MKSTTQSILEILEFLLNFTEAYLGAYFKKIKSECISLKILKGLKCVLNTYRKTYLMTWWVVAVKFWTSRTKKFILT